MLPMTLKEIIARWRILTPEEKLRRRREAIPRDVAQSSLRGGIGASGENPRKIRQDPCSPYAIIDMLSPYC
jgi:hypothetical protein